LIVGSASADQDHAISPYALAAFVNCAKASIASRYPRFVTIRDTPRCGAGWRKTTPDFYSDKQK